MLTKEQKLEIFIKTEQRNTNSLFQKQLRKLRELIQTGLLLIDSCVWMNNRKYGATGTNKPYEKLEKLLQLAHKGNPYIMPRVIYAEIKHVANKSKDKKREESAKLALERIDSAIKSNWIDNSQYEQTEDKSDIEIYADAFIERIIQEIRSREIEIIIITEDKTDYVNNDGRKQAVKKGKNQEGLKIEKSLTNRIKEKHGNKVKVFNTHQFLNWLSGK
jgi:ATP-dependent helicase YprA (DUF1998 family)